MHVEGARREGAQRNAPQRERVDDAAARLQQQAEPRAVPLGHSTSLLSARAGMSTETSTRMAIARMSAWVASGSDLTPTTENRLSDGSADRPASDPTAMLLAWEVVKPRG